jgi:hypothetical protein
LDLSAGAGWISSPIADEHTWRDGKTSFRQILYHELGSIGARLPAPILSPIIAAFIRELVRLELSPLELYRVLLGELDVEEVMRLREGGDDAIERSTVGRVLHDMKELVLVVDRQATSLVDRADRNGDNALTVRELAQILGVEKLIDSALGSLGELVVMRSGDVGLGETLRALLVAPVVVGLERVFAAIRRGLRADTQAFVRLDSNDDGRITLDELLALEGMPLPPQVARALSRLVLSDTDTPNLPVVFAIACARRAQQINGMLSRTASTFCEAYGITRVVERLRAIIGIPGPPSGDGDSAAGAASSSGQPSVVLAHEPSSTTRSERRWHKWRWRLRPNPLSSQAGAGQVAFRRDSTEGRL